MNIFKLKVNLMCIITFASMKPLTSKLPTTRNTVPPKQRNVARISAFHGTGCVLISN